MNAALSSVALLLLAGALLLLFGGRSESALRQRVLAHAGRAAHAPRLRRDEPNLIARPVARTGVGYRLSAWLGLVSDLPARRVPMPFLLLVSGLAAGLVAWGAAALLPAPFHLAAGFAAAVGILRGALLWETARHRDEAFRQIPDAIGLMVRAVRAGLPVSEAVRSVAREMPEPTRSEFQRVISETSIGAPLDRALLGIHQRTGLREYAFLSVVIGLQSQTGGSLAEALDNIGDIVRKRVAMAAKARALAGQARASAGILVALPPFAGTAVSALNPGYLDALFTDPRGHKLLIAAIVMLLFGLLVIRSLIKRSTQG